MNKKNAFCRLPVSVELLPPQNGRHAKTTNQGVNTLNHTGAAGI
jgi:hypothetical protein